MRKLVPVSKQVAQATPDLRRITDVLNSFFNTMAYDPPGDGADGQSYLFYLPWAGHNTHSAYGTQDAAGPLPRSIATVDCGALQLLEEVIPNNNPFIGTILQLLNQPKFRDAATCNGNKNAK